jgi:hypothetical protein
LVAIVAEMTGSNEPIAAVVTGTTRHKDSLSLAWGVNAID